MSLPLSACLAPTLVEYRVCNVDHGISFLFNRLLTVRTISAYTYYSNTFV